MFGCEHLQSEYLKATENRPNKPVETLKHPKKIRRYYKQPI